MDSSHHRTSVTWLSRPQNLIPSLLSLLPIVLVAVYMLSYRLNIPFRDEWRLNGRIAIATADGHLTLHDLLFVNGGHRVFFTNMVTALSTALMRWNVWLEGFVALPLALLFFALIVILLRRTRPDLTALALAPFSLLTFPVFRDYNWWSLRHSHWYFENLFVAAILLLLTVERLTWRRLLAVIALGWCATFTMATGMIVWPMIVLVLLLRGPRDWRMLALVVVLGAPSVFLYLINSGVVSSLGSADVVGRTIVSVDPPRLRLLLEFTFRFLGVGLLYDPLQPGLTTLVGLAGSLVFAASVVYLAAAQRGFKATAPWIGLALFGAGSAASTALGRANLNGVERALTIQYGAAAGLFWIALAALLLMTLRRFYAARSKNTLYRLGLAAGALFSVALLGLYAYSSVTTLRENTVDWGHGLRLSAVPTDTPEQQCVENYLFGRDAACLKLLIVDPEIDPNMLDGLAARRLTIFADDPTRNLLPADAEAESRIVLATSDAWLNVHIRDLLLAGVGEDRLFHVVAEGTHVDNAATIPTPLRQVAVDSAPEARASLIDWLGDARQVWVLTTPDVEALTQPYLDVLKQRGYALTSTTEFQPPDAPLRLTLLGLTR